MNLRCQFTVLMGASALVGGALTNGAADAAPAEVPICSSTADASSAADVDGDGESDVVVGVPRATVSGRDGAGAVDIHRAAGGPQRFSESLFAGLPAPSDGDAFGSSIAFTSNGDDRCGDLAIAAPGADGGRGAVTIALGSDDGISSVGAIRLTGSSAGEHFGSDVVARGNDLWISAPDRTVFHVRKAGAVEHYRFVNGIPQHVQTLTEETPGIPGIVESGDGFGRTLDVSATGPLLIGEPAEDVGANGVDAGTVHVVYDNEGTGMVSSSSTISQDSPGIPGTVEAGDHFGTSVSSDDHTGNDVTTKDIRVSVGVPGEALGTLRGAGTVDSFVLESGGTTPSRATAVTQNSVGVPGADEASDRFGKRVAIVRGGLCIGVPGEDIGRVVDSGRVLCRGLRGYLADEWIVFQYAGSGRADLGRTSPQAGAQIGSQISRLAYTQRPASDTEDLAYGGESLVLGIPGANAGGIPSSGQVAIEVRRVTVDSAGRTENERYGVLATAVSQGPPAFLD